MLKIKKKSVNKSKKVLDKTLAGEVSGSVPDFISIQLRSDAFYHITVLHYEGEVSGSVPAFLPIQHRSAALFFSSFSPKDTQSNF